jgi:hypothetical protein
VNGIALAAATPLVASTSLRATCPAMHRRLAARGRGKGRRHPSLVFSPALAAHVGNTVIAAFTHATAWVIPDSAALNMPDHLTAVDVGFLTRARARVTL